jgi:hypothetical protein
MPILRGVLQGVVLAGVAVAQQAVLANQVVNVFEVADVIANLERFTGKQPQLVADLVGLLPRVFDEEPKVRTSAPRGGNADQTRFAVIGSSEQITATKCLLDQLRRADLQEVRLQCTQVTMPLPVAAASGLAAGKVVEVDEGKAGKMIKDAVAAKGTLRNLPEAGILPLQPCVMTLPRREATAAVAAQPFGRSEVRVVALPLSEKEVWFSLRWRGEPADGPGRPQAPQFETAMRLEPGRGAMVMSPQDQQAVVLWVRFAFTRNAVPAEEKAGKSEPGK